jgi:hypothetical protein
MTTTEHDFMKYFIAGIERAISAAAEGVYILPSLVTDWPRLTEAVKESPETVQLASELALMLHKRGLLRYDEAQLAALELTKGLLIARWEA